MNPLAAVREVERELTAAAVPTPRVDAELLVAHVVGTTRSGVYRADGDLTDEERRRLRSLVERRRQREPLAYVLGEWGFRRLTLAVDRRVLVPRPETESVVERCLVRLRDVAAPRVVDIGTGSGAIALALADEHPGARVVALDTSEEALAVARENLRRTGLADRVELVPADLLAGVEGPFDLVVSNPPYVHPEDADWLQPEVHAYEPPGAIFGVDVHEPIAREALRVLRPAGWLVLECGDGEAPRVAECLRGLGYEDVLTSPDLAGDDRVVEGRAP